jgi:hypothetical protein
LRNANGVLDEPPEDQPLPGDGEQK